MELSLSTRTVGQYTVLTVSGEVDVYTAPRLRERLVELVDDGSRQVVLDIEPLEFLDSTGLGVMVGALKRLRVANGTFSIVCAKEPLLKIFRITALDQVFPIFPSLAAAISTLPETDEAEFVQQPPRPKPKRKPKTPSSRKAKPPTEGDTRTTKKAKQKNDQPVRTTATAAADADHPIHRTEPATADEPGPGNAGWQGYWNGYSFTGPQSDAIVTMYSRYQLSLIEISGRIGVPVHDVRVHLRSLGLSIRG